MKFRVYYDLGCCEGFYYEDFDNLCDAINFANKQIESHIIRFNNSVPISYNVKILY